MSLWPVTWEQLAWLALGVVTVFWMVGAYNRLMRLRNEIGASWAQIEPLLQRRDSALAALITALREPLADESGALDALAQAQGQVRSATEAVRLKPASDAAVRPLAATLAPWASSVSRVLALVEQRPDVQHAETVVPCLAALREVDAGWPFARQRFNEAVEAYNDAARQWPTRMLARLFSFEAATTL